MSEETSTSNALSYTLGPDGTKKPIPGAFSVFLTGTTLDILGIKQLSAAKTSTVGFVSKQKVQKDVQFRGAISDLYSIRGDIANLDYDPVAFRSNPQDTFGDGNNFETMGGLPQDAGCQASPLPPRNNFSQYEVRTLGAGDCQAVLASPGFATFLAAVEPRMEAALLENEVVDVMADELEGLGEEGGEGGGRRDRAISEVQSCSELQYSKGRVISAVQWLPGRKGMVAVACIEAAGFSERVERMGQAQAPDARADKDCWLFATAAADGRVLFWDMRMTRLRFKARNQEKDEPEWRPLFTLPLTSPISGELACAKLSFSFHPDGTPLPVFYVGSADGELLQADWSKEAVGVTSSPFIPLCLGGQSGEEGEQTAKAVRAHSAAVTVLQRSAFRSDLILTMGAWTFAIWMDGSLRAPLCQSPAAPAMYSAGCWSPARPGVLFAGREDGVLEVWDLLERSHEPVLTAQPSVAGIASLAFSPVSPAQAETGGRPVQQLLAIGDAVGVLHLMELPRNLRRRHAQEGKALNALVERELERLDMLSQMAPLRRQMAKGAIDASEEAYLKLEAEFRSQLGLDLSAAPGVAARG
ncbi:hypothetical protein WJX84_004573 [Apatococcus fuscideae]|uniref:Uncharacterized protein n=1 Tax=Apatococcus fuscideae TaxID=2026836 RepID=A0AAW1SPQ6_9CHLO